MYAFLFFKKKYRKKMKKKIKVKHKENRIVIINMVTYSKRSRKKLNLSKSITFFNLY